MAVFFKRVFGFKVRTFRCYCLLPRRSRRNYVFLVVVVFVTFFWVLKESEMGGHHGPKLPPVPDWRIYRVEDVPQLVQVREALAMQGLRDPWLRNEVWKFTERYNKWPVGKAWKVICFTGFKNGLAAALITAAIEYAFFPIRKAPSELEGGHH